MFELFIIVTMVAILCMGIAIGQGEERHRQEVRWQLEESKRFKRAQDMPLFAKLSGLPQGDTAE